MEKGQVIKHLRTHNELNMYRDQLIDMENQLYEEGLRVQAMLNRCEEASKFNETILFGIKEGTLSTIRDYKRMEKILDAVVKQDYNPDKVWGVLIGVKNRIDQLEDSFSRNFNMTTDQYKQQVTQVGKSN